MTGRRRKPRIREIIITVGDYEEIFELNKKENFKQKKENINQRVQKMWEKINEYEQNKQKDQVSIQLESPKKERKSELKDDLFHDLFNNNLNDEIDIYDIEIQENGILMNDINKTDHKY